MIKKLDFSISRKVYYIETVKLGDKEIKLTDISIMDRYSNGSYVVKDKIINSYPVIEEISKENFENLEYIEEKRPEQSQLSFDMLNKESLKEIDDRIIIINNFLDDVEDN